MSINKILSIIILGYNKYNFTKSCLNDLSKLPNDHEIIFIDNGSTDETIKLKDSKEIIYHRFNTNMGFAKGCNYGYSLSTANKVLFLNNDIRVKSNYDNWTQALINNCDDVICGPTMGLLNNNFEFIKEENRYFSEKNSYLSGWCICSSKNIWNKLNLSENNEKQIFSEEFFCYFEDTDLSFRAKKQNIQLRVIDIPVVHFGRQTSSQINTYQLYSQAKKIFVQKWKK